jgi:hypothetical protein
MPGAGGDAHASGPPGAAEPVAATLAAAAPGAASKPVASVAAITTAAIERPIHAECWVIFPPLTSALATPCAYRNAL